MDHQPRSGVCAKKSRRDRLSALAQTQPDWALGFQDETWWSRVAQPSLSAWTGDDHPLRLVEQPVAKDDPDPKALACYGLLLRADASTAEQVWRRFVDGRPVRAGTTASLDWCADRLAAQGKRVLVLIWDNAAWHVSREVRAWLRAHNEQVKRAGKGVRIIACYLPIKSPWLNAIEPKWTPTKQQVVEPDRRLPAHELADRVCTPSPARTNPTSPCPIRSPDYALVGHAANS